MATGKICRIHGCNNVLKMADGQVCCSHRMRMFRHGSYDISPNWPNLKKGQALITPLGYLRININGERMLHHRYIMEQHLRRKLKSNERIHHINGNKTDNKIDNLELIKNNGEHMRKYHPDVCRSRKNAPPYSSEEIANVLQRINEPSGNYIECFCGKKINSRNLCEKHYQWAWKHQFI